MSHAMTSTATAIPALAMTSGTYSLTFRLAVIAHGDHSLLPGLHRLDDADSGARHGNERHRSAGGEEDGEQSGSHLRASSRSSRLFWMPWIVSACPITLACRSPISETFAASAR